MKKYFLIFLLTACVLGGCDLPEKPLMMAANGPQAWIDIPLDGSMLSLGQTYDIVFHTSDLSGVMEGELSINGQVLQVFANPDPNQTLDNHRVPWTPKEPGNYTIHVRTKNGAGQWSDFAESVVTVKGPDETITPTVTQTITPTLTLTATTTTTAAPATLTFSASASTSQFYYGGCAPGEVSVEAVVTPADHVYSIVLFYRLEDTSSGERTEWSNDAMNPSGGGRFTRTVSGNSMPEHERFSSAFWQYQLVATANDGAVIGRSQTFSDITLSTCGPVPVRPPANVVEPQIFIYTEPTKTPIIIK